MELKKTLKQVAHASRRRFICRKCSNTACTCTKLIISCKCPMTAFVHESCLQEEITAKPESIKKSSDHPGFSMYKCKKCKHSVFFRPDFSTQRISCEQYTGQQHCIWVVFVVVYLLLLGAVGLFIYLAIEDPQMLALHIVLIVFLSMVLIFFIYLQHKSLEAVFYVQDHGFHPAVMDSEKAPESEKALSNT